MGTPADRQEAGAAASAGARSRAAAAIDPSLDAHAAVTTEWLLTDGAGGFAFGTALGANTRRYHGLLVAATRPPLGRVVIVRAMIEQIEQSEQIESGGCTVDLSTHCFGEEAALHPGGWTRLRGFEADPPYTVRWTWRLESARVERTLSLPRPGVARIDYRVQGLVGALLRVRPLMPLVGFHELSSADQPPPECSSIASGFRVRAGSVSAAVRGTGATARREDEWWRGFAYPEERARGQSWREDVWSPGVLEWRIGSADVAITIEAALGEEIPPASDPAIAPRRATDTRRSPRERLIAAAGQFVVERRTVPGDRAELTVIAGYPWFADWGRDTMIALPGLLLGPGRLDDAEAVLLGFARNLRRGLIPNCFLDAEPPRYNTADASLWFVHAVREYASALGDDRRRTSAALVDACRAIIGAYREGTDFGIGVDRADSLVRAGDRTDALTWMDAVRDGRAFTPRAGKPVELSALWHHALHALAELTESAAEAASLREEAARTARSIRELFWWPERECLHDVLEPNRGTWRPDGRLRSNQIFAVSLRPSPLDLDQRRKVVSTVRARLLTPYGLRTLDPADPGYRGRYEGDLLSRDEAYHNGTVWPWLIGGWCDAVRATATDAAAGAREIRASLAALVDQLDRGCLGQLPEVYDGDAPHRASGCPAQAWSVAEVLRSLDRLDRPPRE